MTRDELIIVKEALKNVRTYASDTLPISFIKRNAQALEIVTLELVKLHNAELKNGAVAKQSHSK